MRVIAGTARSLPLRTPPGRGTRPTTDKIKETLFNMLQGEIAGAVFMDIFSGSGGIGIEALSRGAKRAYFIERDKRALDCIRENLRFTNLGKSGIVVGADVRLAVGRLTETADIIYLDPPYASGLDKEALRLLGASPCVGEDTLVILEAGRRGGRVEYGDCGFTVFREKEYKTNRQIWMKKRAAVQAARLHTGLGNGGRNECSGVSRQL